MLCRGKKMLSGANDFRIFNATPSSTLGIDTVSILWFPSRGDVSTCAAAPRGSLSDFKAASHTAASTTFSMAETLRSFHLSPTFSYRATFQVAGILRTACFRSRPLLSRSVIAAVKIFCAHFASSSHASNFAMMSSKEIVSPGKVSPEFNSRVLFSNPFSNCRTKCVSSFSEGRIQKRRAYRSDRQWK